MLNLFKSVPSISVNELQDKLKENITLIDVRTPGEYNRGHIKKAINMPLGTIQKDKIKQDEVYVICASGMRSKRATKQLRKEGLNAINVRGGMHQYNIVIKNN